jgi:type II secretory pathway component PulF
MMRACFLCAMPMSPAERLIDWNRQAAAVIRLGIPLELGLGKSPAETLDRISQRLAIDVGSESSLDDLVRKHDLPEGYRKVARLWLSADDPAPMFASVAEVEQQRQSVSSLVRRGLTEPLIVIALAYFGLLVLCTFTVPALRAEYEQIRQTPSLPAQVLIGVADWMPVWSIAVPVLLLAFLLFGRMANAAEVLSRIPGGVRVLRWSRGETESLQLAELTRIGTPTETAVQITAGGEDKLPTISKRILTLEDEQQKSRSFRRLASFYRFLIDEQKRTYFTRLPAYLGLQLAAIVALLYVLALFQPWVTLMKDLSMPGVGQ